MVFGPPGYNQPSYNHMYMFINGKATRGIPDHRMYDFNVFVPSTLSNPKIHLTSGGTMLNSGSVVVHQREQ